ncbi:hypothetical protein FHX42_002513 [Saccharopolyspora lacisalsi]|uniref:Uncharacterized protein n=1 Tax=Halosaccharopolyspora lacisalsi TaxID=1000566 RepID=A0A839DT56_9PSEU|nr:hypothetical protein [Halosaccharopolyspora lacisalsi]MBA8825162.1 hypothetical protein [Halosaccharopolyspora lacisalsi]
MQVFPIHRTHHENESPLENCDVAIPSDRYELSYRIPVEDGPWNPAARWSCPRSLPSPTYRTTRAHAGVRLRRRPRRTTSVRPVFTVSRCARG